MVFQPCSLFFSDSGLRFWAELGSVPEMPDSGQEAGDASLLAELEGLLVPLGAPRVDQAADTGVYEEFWTVGKGEKGIAGGNRNPGAGAETVP